MKCRLFFPFTGHIYNYNWTKQETHKKLLQFSFLLYTAERVLNMMQSHTKQAVLVDRAAKCDPDLKYCEV